LTAAHRLARQGLHVTVLEREPRPGGLCSTQERNGFRFDLGGHRFISRSPALVEMVRGLLGEELLERRRSSVVLNGGRRLRYPLQLDDVLSQVPTREGARILSSFARAQLTRTRDVSFEDWVVRRFGRVLYDGFFGPYTEKLWGVAPDQISADWASQRISLMSLTDVLVRLLGLRRGRARTYARRYLYPRLGIGQIFERMAESLRSLGGRLILGARVTGLDLAATGVRAVRFVAEDGGREIACDGVISTLALPALARLVSPRMPAEVEKSISRLRFRGIRLLNVLLDGPEVSPHTWMYVSEPRYVMSRIQEPRQRSPEMAPPGKTSVMLEVPCEPGDGLWSAADGELYERCMRDLACLGFSDLRRRTLEYFSSYVEEGYPIYHLDYQRDRACALDFVGQVPNLMSVGRQGAFRYVFMDTAMEMGIMAAEALLGGRRTPTRTIADLRSEAGLIEARTLTA
jgi:protoporphyrinogen oxidase